MWKGLLALFQFLFAIWNKLPESTREKIIDVIVETFVPIFKAFYKKHTNQKSEDENND